MPCLERSINTKSQGKTYGPVIIIFPRLLDWVTAPVSTYVLDFMADLHLKPFKSWKYAEIIVVNIESIHKESVTQ